VCFILQQIILLVSMSCSLYGLNPPFCLLGSFILEILGFNFKNCPDLWKIFGSQRAKKSAFIVSLRIVFLQEGIHSPAVSPYKEREWRSAKTNFCTNSCSSNIYSKKSIQVNKTFKRILMTELYKLDLKETDSVKLFFWLNPTHIVFVERKDLTFSFDRPLLTKISSVLCPLASSTHRFFPRILRQFCLPQRTLNLHYSPYMLKRFPRILRIRRKNEENAERNFHFHLCLKTSLWKY